MTTESKLPGSRPLGSVPAGEGDAPGGSSTQADALAHGDTELVLVLEEEDEGAAAPHPGEARALSTSNPRYATPADPPRFAAPEDRFAEGMLAQAPRHDGPHPFWLREARGAVHGPYAFATVVTLVRAEANRSLWGAEISADGRAYTALARFAERTGQEGLLHDEKAKVVVKPSDVVSYLDERSVLSVLARAGADRLTGRLVVLPEGLRRHVHREVHLKDGVPTYVYASDDALQLPELLASRRLVPRPTVVELVHEALGSGRALEDLVATRTQAGRSRALLMKERMADMLPWRLGRFVFDPTHAPEPGPPLARSMAALLPELVHRGASVDDLRALLMPTLGGLLDAKLRAPRALDAALAELGLTRAQRDAAQRVVKARRLSGPLAAQPAEERLLLGVTYLLLELGLLVRG